jgi:hypothetical protein
MMKRMRHKVNLTERLDGCNPPACQKPRPILQQLNPMQFAPGLDESAFARRKGARKDAQVFNCEHSLSVRRDHVKVRPMVALACLREHADGKAVESRQLRHGSVKAGAASCRSGIHRANQTRTCGLSKSKWTRPEQEETEATEAKTLFPLLSPVTNNGHVRDFNGVVKSEIWKSGNYCSGSSAPAVIHPLEV